MALANRKPSGVYRRRRLAALLVLIALAGTLYAGADSEAGTRPVSYTVAPGDTLWSIVTSRYPPSEDPRIKIEEIREMNEMESYRIQPGARIGIPPPQTS